MGNKRISSKQDCTMIFNMAKDFLLSFDQISEEILNKHLTYWEKSKPTSIEELLKRLLESAKSRQQMSNVIGDINDLESLLLGFSPKELLKNYSTWEDIFDSIKLKHTPPGRMVKEPRSLWVQFCKTILSGAEFLSKFETPEDFDAFVKDFDDPIDLPLFLGRKIAGIQFALACDFLKEIGYPNYVKPDIHLKKIFAETGLSQTEDDVLVFKDIIKMAETIGKEPYEVDKLFWLIGSGNFYLNRISIGRHRDEFIKMVTSALSP